MSNGAGQARRWVEHLRQGGTTPWLAFRDRPEDPDASPEANSGASAGTAGAVGSTGIPGAIQLEVLRRLNAWGTPPAGVAERVLASSPPGRGLPDLALVGVHPPTNFGPRPVDPASLPLDELLRLAVGVLAEQVSESGAGDSSASGAGDERAVPDRAGSDRAGSDAAGLRGLAPWRRRVEFAGDPWLADSVRAARAQHGMRRGLRSPEVLVLATDLPSWLWHVWSWRVVHLARPVTWSWWLDRWLGRGSLPPRADLSAILSRRSAEVDASRIRLVCGDPETALRGSSLAREVPPLYDAWGTGSATPDAAAMEVQAQTNAVLRVMLPESQVRAISAGRLWPLLAEVQPAQPAAGGVPERYREFLEAAGAQMSGLIAGGDYPVHGDPALLQRVTTGSDRAQDDKVLDVALQAVRRAGRAAAPAQERVE